MASYTVNIAKPHCLRQTAARFYKNIPDGYIEQCMLSSQLGSGISVVLVLQLNLQYPTLPSQEETAGCGQDCCNIIGMHRTLAAISFSF